MKVLRISVGIHEVQDTDETVEPRGQIEIEAQGPSLTKNELNRWSLHRLRSYPLRESSS
jgi:hypothetical protein